MFNLFCLCVLDVQLSNYFFDTYLSRSENDDTDNWHVCLQLTLSDDSPLQKILHWHSNIRSDIWRHRRWRHHDDARDWPQSIFPGINPVKSDLTALNPPGKWKHIEDSSIGRNMGKDISGHTWNHPKILFCFVGWFLFILSLSHSTPGHSLLVFD